MGYPNFFFAMRRELEKDQRNHPSWDMLNSNADLEQAVALLCVTAEDVRQAAHDREYGMPLEQTQARARVYAARVAAMAWRIWSAMEGYITVPEEEKNNAVVMGEQFMELDRGHLTGASSRLLFNIPGNPEASKPAGVLVKADKTLQSA